MHLRQLPQPKAESRKFDLGSFVRVATRKSISFRVPDPSLEKRTGQAGQLLIDPALGNSGEDGATVACAEDDDRPDQAQLSSETVAYSLLQLNANRERQRTLSGDTHMLTETQPLGHLMDLPLQNANDLYNHHDLGLPVQSQPAIISTNRVTASTPGQRSHDSYLATYFEYGSVWCPVLDKGSLQESSDTAAGSLLLRHALALCGNHINPPLMQHASSTAHYKRAKDLFYEAYDINPVTRISAVMLFYWWSTGPPNVVSMNTNWWWTGAAIRLAQEIGLHREPHTQQQMQFGRPWVFDGGYGGHYLPCIIDPDYCDVKMISVDDFPDPSDIRADIFVRWVKLTEIMGRISKMLCIRKDTCTSTAPLASELVNWVQSLPDRLQLQIGGDRTTGFNRDVHGLNLVYLATITLLNLRKNRAGRILPKAGRPAVVAASCIARIFEDYMARGSVRFLAGQAGWYIAVAILALLHARGDPHLQPFADRDIRTLRTALRQMASLWHSSKMFDLGFDKLVAVDPARMVGTTRRRTRPMEME
ncbi:unnamed protein product [Parascedosporium putredinis]|uniref:Transcription factor domain-containing protein n=1 Tax=Parascedosporium putredinis TaxID=1442378 RepID=A0A9P1H4J6_9PEZI|nr:unnamed protein product [Parascedosporium putredinis]CAI7996837.1 unnamed protein product [Parascedosporium putredinis]